MDKKYQDILDRYQTLNLDLAKSEVISNPEKLKVTSQEFSKLEPLVERINQLKKMEIQLTQAQDTIAEGDDPELMIIAQEEIDNLTEAKALLESDLEQDLKPKDPLDKKNIIMEIRAGTGGNEAALFAAELFDVSTGH